MGTSGLGFVRKGVVAGVRWANGTLATTAPFRCRHAQRRPVPVWLFGVVSLFAGQTLAQTAPSWRTDTPQRVAPPPELEKPEFEFTVDREQLLENAFAKDRERGDDALDGEAGGTAIGIEGSGPDQSRYANMTTLTLPLPQAYIEMSPNFGGEANAIGKYRLVRRSSAAPDYPKRAYRDRTEGWVDLMLTISPQGRVVEVEVLASEPGAVFQKAAVQAAEKWRFDPPEDDGVVLPQHGLYRISFKM